jgi:acyl-CoA synthetase (AMP-forming)/AMP-acid ligase II
MNLALDLLTDRDPHAPALYAGSVVVTYGELQRSVERAARLLMERGARRHDRIALLADNGVFFVVCYLAVIRIGMVVVPLPTDLAAEAILGITRDAGARIILVSRRYRRHVSGWEESADPAVLTESDVAEFRGGDELLPPAASEEDLAALMFTSGSTGRAKGVMVTHGNIACNTRDIVRCLQLSSDDRVMVVLPLFYCFGLSLLHTHLAVGGSIVINNQFMYPEAVLQDIEERACTGLAGVPSTYQILLRKSRFTKSLLPSMRWMQQAGGRLPNPCIQEINEAFPHVRLYVMYGQTEATARLSYLPPERLRDKLGSVGCGLPSTRIEVVARDGRPVEPGSGEVGEIVASGANITRGYWNDPEETAKYFRDGKLYTGDLGCVDVDGFIYVLEREREIIKCGGSRVSAKEVEDVIAKHQSVVEVAVVGASHPILGEAIVAFVTQSGQPIAGSAAILDHCKRLLPASKVPELIVYMQRLPHGSTGKILKPSLRELAKVVAAAQLKDVLSANLQFASVDVIDVESRRPRAVAEPPYPD